MYSDNTGVVSIHKSGNVSVEVEVEVGGPPLYVCDGWVIQIRHRVREAIFNSDGRV